MLIKCFLSLFRFHDNHFVKKRKQWDWISVNEQNVKFIRINSLITLKDWIEKVFQHNSEQHINLYPSASAEFERKVGLACQPKIKDAVVCLRHLVEMCLTKMRTSCCFHWHGWHCCWNYVSMRGHRLLKFPNKT